MGDCAIRKVAILTGIITTFAGTGNCTFGGDNGQATSAELNEPYAVALDSAGKATSCYLSLLLLLTFYHSRQRLYRRSK